MGGKRQANPIDLAIQPGIFMQRTARQSQARWIDGDNVRWYRGLPQKAGGYQEVKLLDTNGARVFYKGHVRSAHQWDSLDGQNWIAFGTEYKLYLVNNGQLYDITPIRYTSTIVNGFATQAGSRLVTVTDVAHGAQPGDFVTYAGASALGNVSLDGEWQIFNVLDLNTYQLLLDVPASTTSAGGGGTIQANYDISAGLTSDGTLSGFGTGGYGLEAYGTPRTLSTFGGSARVWSLDNFGEDLLASPNGEALYWWQRATGPDSRAIVRPNAPPNIEHMLVGPDDRHVIALGANVDNQALTAPTGVQDRMFVRWCTGDNFDDWVEQQTNDAGSKRLDTGSRLITACKTRTSVLLFTDEAIYTVALTSGTDVYAIQPLGSAVKIISAGAAVDVAGTIYFMGQNSFYVYNGVLSDLPCDIADFVFGTAGAPRMNRQMQSKVTCNVVKDLTEIHWHFPSVDSDENDSTVIYNYDMQCWYLKKYRGGREAGLDYNVAFNCPIGFNDTGFLLEESGFDADVEEPILNFLTSWEGELQMTSRLDSGQTLMLWAASGGANLLLLHTMYPDFKQPEQVGLISQFTSTIQCFGRDHSGDPTVYGDVITVTPTTDQVDPQFCQRRVGFYIENYNFGDFWRMDVWSGLATAIGRRA